MNRLNFTRPTAHRLYSEAETALHKKDFAKAFKHFKYILDNYPENFDHAQLLMKCAVAASKTGDTSKAIKYLKHSFKLKPTPQKLDYLNELTHQTVSIGE